MKLLLSVDDCHWYVNAPPALEADAVVTVNAVGLPPEQMVSSPATVPGVTSLTVTVNTFDVAVHATLFKVLVTIRR